MGDRHLGRSHWPHGGAAVPLAGGSGTGRGWFLPVALGLVGMSHPGEYGQYQ